MISTSQLTFIILLVIVLFVAVWWFAIAMNYKSYLNKSVYTRGANGEANDNINLKCGSGKKICVYRATQICSNPDSNNFEMSNLEPIANGAESNVTYGDFDPKTTVDFTSKMGNECNGKSECTFKFTPDWSSKGVECNGKSQLIATYNCVANDSDCKPWKPVTNSFQREFESSGVSSDSEFNPPLPSYPPRFPSQLIY
ncbi:hypothetical protein OAG24_00585 [bacterium]|nr:hypothetical protein [bacterium]